MSESITRAETTLHELLVAVDAAHAGGVKWNAADLKPGKGAWASLRAQEADRASVLARVERAHAGSMGGHSLPVSFRRFFERFGYFDVTSNLLGQGLQPWFAWLEALWARDDVESMLFDIDPRSELGTRGGGRIAGMRIVDNPGDTPMYALVALLGYSSGSGESLWLYEGWDAASGDGIPLCPIGATFHEAVVVLLLGLADLLFLPSKKAQPLVGVARKTWDAKQRRLAAQALAGIEQLIEASRDVDVRGPADRPSASLAEGGAAVKTRIAALRATLELRADRLPFDRPPVKLVGDERKPESASGAFERAGGRELFLAAEEGDLRALRGLLKGGVDLDVRGVDGRTALHHAVVAENGEAVVELLLAKGAAIDARDARGKTPLHAAVRHPKAVKTLLARGADASAIDDGGGTALHLAISNESLLVVQLLVRNGADVNLVTRNGWSPLALANGPRKAKIREFLKSKGARLKPPPAGGH
ncbi:MAG: ankyrin repeat domain-containing protein [Polyangiaceae bacterium]